LLDNVALNNGPLCEMKLVRNRGPILKLYIHPVADRLHKTHCC